MMAGAGILHVVETACPAAEPKPISPERRLRTLFRAEARLERQLIETRQAIQGERRRYAVAHALGCFPSLDTLRRLFS